ncbi:MAG TPA: hypothetical protein DCY79_15625 [Planctomycetaceae bacterium]|nr:hypothetical protein [Blastopirellula sp.]HAY81233.1 hypothetical protein [Planctomycetaceae bacterium]
MESLCRHCAFAREIISGKGTRYLLCEKALVDERYRKYPPQPLLSCHGYTASEAKDTEAE